MSCTVVRRELRGSSSSAAEIYAIYLGSSRALKGTYITNTRNFQTENVATKKPNLARWLRSDLLHRVAACKSNRSRFSVCPTPFTTTHGTQISSVYVATHLTDAAEEAACNFRPRVRRSSAGFYESALLRSFVPDVQHWFSAQPHQSLLICFTPLAYHPFTMFVSLTLHH